MNKLKPTFKILFLLLLLVNLSNGQDWANLNKYKNDNAKLGLPAKNEIRIVFMGNSITEIWADSYPNFFSGKPYINRGIGGQTTPQMLIRFRADVINIQPNVVVILAGTNDIAGNTGPSTLEMIAENIFSMAELAKANGIKVILSSVLPAFDYPWNPGLNPATKIPALNAMIRNYTEKNGIIYLDYYTAMVDNRKGLKDEYTYDGVHPNEAGFRVMSLLAEKAITIALNQK